ncbi:DUF2339 domain-containing protein [Luteolibacter sp. Populi]|uniref:DUF2339 domain-containing protein n=1 Tax=Luteolibacter sp. Populi TaxID=3230487 RepID=UPI003467773D
MNEEIPGAAWSEIQRIRERLAAMEHRHAEEIALLRTKLAALESQLGAAPEAAPEPAPVFPTFASEVPAPPPEPVPAAAPAPAPAPRPVPIPAVVVPPPVEKGSLELRLGRVWLVRVGIALLLTGLVLLGNFAYKNWIRDLPAAVRLAALFFSSFAISGAGVYLGRRENMRLFGEVVLAGGLAFFYWCTFAAHHVPRLQVVESRVAAGVMLLGAAGAIVGIALRRDSQITALMGLLLASYATVLQPLGWLSAASNLVLAAAGTGLLTRRGWGGAGIAAMVGIYGSFLWWQIAGAAGMRPDDPAALYFLPPVWLVFALPGIRGMGERFGGLSERARAWMGSANNLAFFGLFSALWLEQRGSVSYWQVPAVFGAVLLLLGSLGRWKNSAAGGQLVQGLAALTLAMTIKLEGDTLALGFATQALVMALAHLRFGGKTEAIFACLAAVAGALWLTVSPAFGHEMPLWSRATCAFLIAAATFPLFRSCVRREQGTVAWQVARAAAGLVLSAGAMAILFGWSIHLEAASRYLAVLAIGLAMTAFTLLADRSRRLPMMALWAAVFQAAGTLFLLTVHQPSSRQALPAPWMPALAMAVSMATHWLWVHRLPAGVIKPRDPASRAGAFQWLTTVTVALALYACIDAFEPGIVSRMASFGIAALILAAVGRYLLSCPLITVAAALLLPELIRCQSEWSPQPWITQFLPVLTAAGIATIAGLPHTRPASPVAQVLARILGMLSWALAWEELSPLHWGDIMAASALAVMVLTRRKLKATPPEAWALLVLSAAWLISYLGEAPWHRDSFPSGLRGWLVPATLFATPFLAKAAWLSRREIRQAFLALACAALAAWSTEALVRYEDWKPVAVLWTVLGFLLVSTGLWRKLAILRHAGFALLAIALFKLFIVDVWDFATFFRITAFLALGVALVVLGFFYNRFADALKKLLEADEA